jgi:hypothetical protein
MVPPLILPPLRSFIDKHHFGNDVRNKRSIFQDCPPAMMKKARDALSHGVKAFSPLHPMLSLLIFWNANSSGEFSIDSRQILLYHNLFKLTSD